MKTQIYLYRLYLFGSKKSEDEDDYYVELDQVQGQKLAMLLAGDAQRKFFIVDGNVVNRSAIRDLKRIPSMKINPETQKFNLPEVRELTLEEEKMQKIYDEFQGKKLLN